MQDFKLWFQLNAINDLKKLKLASLVARRELAVTGSFQIKCLLSLSKAIRGILLSAKLTAQPNNAISPLTQAMKDKRCSEAANMKEWAQLTAANRNEGMHPRIRKGVQVFSGLGGLKGWNTQRYLHTFFFVLLSIKLTVAKHKIYQLKGINISFFLGYDASSYTFHHLLYTVQKVSTPGVKKPVIPSTSHHLNSVWKPWDFLIPYNPAPAPFSPSSLKTQRVKCLWD